MNDQINLYRPELLEKIIELSGQVILKIVAATLVVLLLLGWREQWRLGRLEHDLVEARNDLNKTQTQIELQKNQQVLTKTDDYLSQQLAQERQALHIKTALLEHLSEGKQQEFSHFLIGLSHQHIKGLWLKGIQVDHDGQLSLVGRVVSADVLPRYLDRLADADVFGKQYFHAFKLRPLSPDIPKEADEIKAGIAAQYFELKAERASP